jgi:dihydroxyacetone kinase-like protein
MTTNTDTLVRVIRAAASSLQQAAGELGELDSVAGDGDHGIAMETATTRILARLDTESVTNVPELLELIGTEFSAVGGSMGALLSVVFADLGDALPEGPQELDAAAVVRYLTVTREALSELGGAQPGDKTIVDAVAGAQVAAETAAVHTDGAAAVLVASAEGAQTGAASTADMVARIGRASRLGERSRGSVDAGARSFAIVLSAVADVYSTEALK